MNRPRTHTVACLAGDGVGPELMAEATRMLCSVGRMHRFTVEDVHVPFGSEALTRSGHPLPPVTRAAVLGADAVLVAALGEPALGGVESELDLRARVTAVVSRRAAFTLVSPLDEESEQWAVERAFALARRSRGQLAAVGHDERWSGLVADAAVDEAVDVRQLTVLEAFQLLAFAPERLDVVVSPAALATALDEMAAGGDRRERVVAQGRLAAEGPSVFSPAHSEPSDLAGHGVADPSSMLLAAALLLRDGLGEWPAAETLTAALSSTRRDESRPDASARRTFAASTRDFADAVVRMLPSSHPNAEFVREATG